MRRIWLLVLLAACTGSSSDGDDPDDTDVDDTDVDDTDTDVEVSDLTVGQTWLEGDDVSTNFVHVFHDWAGIETGAWVATSEGYALLDLTEDEPRFTSPPGSELFRLLPLDVGGDFPWLAAGVGTEGLVTFTVVEGQSEPGFTSVDSSPFVATDIVPVPDTVARVAVADFELGKIGLYRWDGFQLAKQPFYDVDLAGVVALHALDETTLLAATEPSNTENGHVYEVTLSEGNSSVSDLGEIGLQPRDIDCLDDVCAVSCFGSDEVFLVDMRPTRRAGRAGKVGVGFDAVEAPVGLRMWLVPNVSFDSTLGVAVGSDAEPPKIFGVDPDLLELGTSLIFDLPSGTRAHDLDRIDDDHVLLSAGDGTGYDVVIGANEP